MTAISLPACSGEMDMAEPRKLERTITSFDLVVRAPFAKTAPLFGPEGERAWAGKDWCPRFVYPLPARDEQGAVFTIEHGPGPSHAVWVTTRFDVEAKHFQYVYFMPDLLVTMIDVRFKITGKNETAVNVVYTRTALTLTGNEHVAAMTRGDQSAGTEWQAAIDHYLATGK